MADRLLLAVIYFAVGTAYTWLALLAMLLFAKGRRLAIVSGGIGFGPTLFTRHLFGVPIDVRLVPLSSFVTPYPALYVGRDFEAATAQVAARVEAKELRRCDELSFLERVGFASLVSLVAFAFAVAALGPRDVVRVAIADLRVLALGVIGPFSVAPDALDAMLARLHAAGPFSVAARFTTVLLAGQIFTIGNFQYIWRDRDSNAAKALAKVATVLLLPGLAAMVAWLLAYVVWVVH